MHKRSQTMCFYCRTNSQPMLKGEDIPLGMDDENLINCGCLYDVSVYLSIYSDQQTTNSLVTDMIVLLGSHA